VLLVLVVELFLVRALVLVRERIVVLIVNEKL